MMLFPRSSAPRSYRFVARVAGHALPSVDKAVRLRCTLSAADHSIVGVSALVLPLGTDVDCEHAIELVHDANGQAPPKYFELVASLAPCDAPGTKFVLWPDAVAGEDPYEYRVAGIMDPSQAHVTLPDIVLRGA